MPNRSPWSPERVAQHAQTYPPDEKAKRNRLAQQRYRKVHAKRIAKVRTITNMLLRGEINVDELLALLKRRQKRRAAKAKRAGAFNLRE
jgi:DNA-binding protein H-NS